ncbi:MAG: HRDC domain-containing protein [Actinomycetota bacterium]|nr:HRDC domain-containing protein [Actinomycetota bacterium]
MSAVELIVDKEVLMAVIDRLGSADRYALDTEFHRERTYWPKVALVQVAWAADSEGPAGVALIDPQAVDISPLAEVLAGPGTMVAHAADQDLEVLDLVCGRGPSRLFDTQVAAGFVGWASASLASLSVGYLDIEVAKGDRLTDWSRRPLTESQLAYAAADVDHLLELADALVSDLETRERRAWAEEECEGLRLRSHSTPDPAKAWWKLRDSRKLQGSARGVAQAVAAWRDERARELDQPLRSVLPDLALQSIAQSAPTTPAALERCRGLDGRHMRPVVVDGVLAAVAHGKTLRGDQLVVPPTDEVPREMRPAVALAAAWVAQLGRERHLDAALLATRWDIGTFLRGDPASRLNSGWRAKMAGEPLRRLLAGEAALAFDGQGGLTIEARSYRPFDIHTEDDSAARTAG